MKNSPTQIVVGGAIGAALVAVAWFVLGWPYFVVAAAALAYEGWTLVNQYPNDTISEIIWTLSKRPMVPFLGGLAVAWSIASGVMTNPWLIFAIGFLAGHFWFQRYDDED